VGCWRIWGWMRVTTASLLICLLGFPPLVDAGILCRKACGCTCRLDAQSRRCSNRQRVVATRSCRRGCNLLVRLCGSFCAVGVGAAAIECRDRGLTEGFCDLDLETARCL
jgi:hypothetical protein